MKLNEMFICFTAIILGLFVAGMILKDNGFRVGGQSTDDERPPLVLPGNLSGNMEQSGSLTHVYIILGIILFIVVFGGIISIWMLPYILNFFFKIFKYIFDWIRGKK